jgi:hypothetical protein
MCIYNVYFTYADSLIFTIVYLVENMNIIIL